MRPLIPGLPLAVGLAAASGGLPPDPLSVLGDTFGGTATLAQRGWTVFGGSGLSDQTIANGELHLATTAGGAGNTWWYSQVSAAPGGEIENAGALIYKLVTGDFDCRVRMRVRNAAGDASPSSAALEWRFAGLQAQDPTGLSGGAYNYAHIGLGSDPNGQNRIEWKVTDAGGAVEPQSTYNSDAGSSDLDYDLRMVRSTQTFELYYRRTDEGEALASDATWTQVAVGDIVKGSNTPARANSATPVAFPDTLAVGIMPPYAGPQATVDLQCWVEEIQFRSA